MAVMSWKEVVAIHNSQSGISTKGGRARSVLCNQAKEGYADEIQGEQIFYRVTASTNAQGVAALKKLVGLAEHIRVFEKLGVNQWVDHGDWFVHDCAKEQDGEVFLLTKNRR